jgi:phosphatidylserine decarboxylase
VSGNGNRIFAREGIPVLLVLLILTGATYVWFGFPYSLFFLFLFLLGLILFRDPQCKVPAAPLAILSPASGKVVSITETSDPWINRAAIRIRIKISFWDAHILRCPTEGKVINQWSKNDLEPEFDRQYAYLIQTDEADGVVIALGMNQAAKFTRMWIIPGERVGQGQRCGFLYVSGVIDVYISANSRVNINPGQKIESGTSMLGFFVHGKQVSSITPQ